MPRKARIVIPGYLYHVTQRGNYRQYVFEEDQDYVTYLRYMAEKCRKCQVEIYAFCLMGNHVHFLMKPLRKDSLGSLFSTVHMKYAHYFNRKKGQRGHLWQGRFYSCMVVGSHIKEVFRYIENNPVRARMVQKAWQYSWSSARAHMGKQYNVIQLADAGDYVDIRNWKQYLSGQEKDDFLKEIRDKTRKGLMLASEQMISKIENSYGINIRSKPVGRPKKSVCP